MKPEPRHLLIGVDGGGTGCRTAISDPTGRHLGGASGGPANFATDRIGTVQNILAALESAASDAGLSENWSTLCVAHVGLAGVMDVADADAVATALPFDNVTVTGDRDISVAGALGSHDGILMAIGTGTIVAAQSGHAKRYFGGWGLDLSDQASGAWLGQRALRQAILAHDGLLAHSDLTRALIEQFDGTPNAAIAFTRQAKPADYAVFAPMIVEAARNNDLNGQALMARGASYLETCIAAADLKDTDILCLSGGVGPHYAPYLAQTHQDRLRPPKGSALEGALYLAQQKLQHLEHTR